jgi:DNA ligase-1
MSEQGTYGFRLFAELVHRLGTSTRTSDKIESLVHYFHNADDRDKVWLIALFSGRRPKRTIKTSLLINWCLELTGIPEWLFHECYHTVGDLGETLALLVCENPGERNNTASLHEHMAQLLSLSGNDEQAQAVLVKGNWTRMSREERFVFNKLITGNFRIGVSQQMMINALAESTHLPASLVAHRISGQWDPVDTRFQDLLDADPTSIDISKPYPFYLAYAVDGDPAALGGPAEWQAEWKWDGIRGQVIVRDKKIFIWSRGEELMTEKFPELTVLNERVPEGTVIDGEILCIDAHSEGWKALPFALLQTRIGRKNVTRKHLKESPVGFIAYDLLEFGGEDWRERPLAERREKLEIIVKEVEHPLLRISPVLIFDHWDELSLLRQGSRDVGSEGLMLKRKESVYQAGRKRGDWYKWKIDPLTIDGVMIYAQKGHGRRSNLFTDYTFAVRDGERLVSFAKAYSGLTDKEFAEVDAFVKRNAVEKFGPVRTVKPELVFEIAFEGIAASSRHKSGVALRFPRINRWRKDKTVNEINTLDDLKEMLERYGKKS